jgi:hypothetical protein
VLAGAIVLVGVVVLAAAAFVVAIDAAPSAPPVSPSSQATKGAVPHFTHVVVVVFENRSSEAVLGYRGAPTFNRLAARFALLRNYRAVAHPSLPNYLALVSGSTHGIHNDCVSCLVGGASLADTIRQAGLTWRAYVEGYKGPGTRPAHPAPFFARIPFLRFDGVTDSTRQQQDIQPISSFVKALRAGRLPTSRSSSRICATTCTTARSQPAIVGCAGSWDRSSGVPRCIEAPSSSHSTRPSRATTSAAAALSRRSSPAPSFARTCSQTGPTTITRCSARSRTCGGSRGSGSPPRQLR